MQNEPTTCYKSRVLRVVHSLRVAARICNKVTRQACCNPAVRPLGAAAKIENEPTNCYKSRTPTGPLPNGRGSDKRNKGIRRACCTRGGRENTKRTHQLLQITYSDCT